MLANGLGKILRRRAADSKRFVDLFAGSGAVSWYVAENTASSAVAADLQQFAAVLAESVICRNQVIDGEALWLGWRTRAEALVEANPLLDRLIASKEFVGRGLAVAMSDKLGTFACPATVHFSGHTVAITLVPSRP